MRDDESKNTVEILDLSTRKVAIRKVDAATFRAAFAAARPVLRYGEFTVPPDRYDYESAENYLTEDGKAGFSVSRLGWLQSVFSVLPERGFLQAAGHLMVAKSNKLNCMVGSNGTDHLVKSYEKCGFVTCAVTTDDAALLRKLYGDEYVDRFLFDHGTPRHVFMVNRDWRNVPLPETAGRVGFSGDVPVFDDYYNGKKFTAELAKRISEKEGNE